MKKNVIFTLFLTLFSLSLTASDEGFYSEVDQKKSNESCSELLKMVKNRCSKNYVLLSKAVKSFEEHVENRSNPLLKASFINKTNELMKLLSYTIFSSSVETTAWQCFTVGELYKFATRLKYCNMEDISKKIAKNFFLLENNPQITDNDGKNDFITNAIMYIINSNILFLENEEENNKYFVYFLNSYRNDDFSEPYGRLFSFKKKFIEASIEIEKNFTKDDDKKIEKSLNEKYEKRFNSIFSCMLKDQSDSVDTLSSKQCYYILLYFYNTLQNKDIDLKNFKNDVRQHSPIFFKALKNERRHEKDKLDKEDLNKIKGILEKDAMRMLSALLKSRELNNLKDLPEILNYFYDVDKASTSRSIFNEQLNSYEHKFLNNLDNDLSPKVKEEDSIPPFSPSIPKTEMNQENSNLFGKLSKAEKTSNFVRKRYSEKFIEKSMEIIKKLKKPDFVGMKEENEKYGLSLEIRIKFLETLFDTVESIHMNIQELSKEEKTPEVVRNIIECKDSLITISEQIKELDMRIRLPIAQKKNVAQKRNATTENKRNDYHESQNKSKENYNHLRKQDIRSKKKTHNPQKNITQNNMPVSDSNISNQNEQTKELIHIKKFANFSTELMFLSGISGDFPKNTIELLNTLNNSKNLFELRQKLSKGNNLEKLSGKKEGKMSIRINDKYRIEFEFDEKNSEFNDVKASNHYN